MDKERIDEALELLWILEEEDKNDLNRFKLSSEDEDVDTVLEKMLYEGVIRIEGDKVQLTSTGREISKGLIRRHRLAERLFTDVFDLKKATIHEDACKMEHILSSELTDSVCTFLGHPPFCPHGKPIPRGECCKKYRVNVAPVVTRLNNFEVGQVGKIVFIVSSDPQRLNRLNSIGIIAGSNIKLLQRKPSIVVQIDETTVALDPDIAKEIHVKRLS
ncbi:iron-dependent repressor IdeR [bacterium BMS3Abin07]|nr:iron-dependent repressor IdeR [bacterium BMS3Abin07]GBE32577.1 iron-dependent repressor IdeR [bacterium BMS3Bbin05]HDO22505.1 DtxR family transcriptional regulator [Nitrospirota bacterium]HDZ88854.1 DtxR family transcriptional regulator [Nitrospirota bacterium]